MPQCLNPFLPLTEYIPDGEPHVFGDRVYLFGSHDNADADDFCDTFYRFYSAPLNDLSSWTSKGINFSSAQDPMSKEVNRDRLYAPDVVQGNDGKFYLYYSLAGKKGYGSYFGPIGVAVCDTPDGKYEFLGYVKNKDCSTFYGNGHTIFDPGVMNDDGIIRLYIGTFYPFHNLPKIIRPILRHQEATMFNVTSKYIKEHQDDVMGPVTCTLAEDMMTLTSEPVRILPVHDKNSPFYTKSRVFMKDGHRLYGHGFYEGSSIRKINGKYYFIYSSMNNHELCYAMSDYPDHDFTYGGVIISNGDVGYQGRNEKERANTTGTTHGSLCQINGQWYVFYHRSTHASDYSRQACAEKIFFKEDGSIAQVEMTSCGLNEGDLIGKGSYDAGICCNLSNGHMPHVLNLKRTGFPMVYEENGHLIVKNMDQGCYANYKYFDLTTTKEIVLQARGQGELEVKCNDILVGKQRVDSTEFESFTFSLKEKEHTKLTFVCASGKIDISGFEFI